MRHQQSFLNKVCTLLILVGLISCEKIKPEPTPQLQFSSDELTMQPGTIETIKLSGGTGIYIFTDLETFQKLNKQHLEQIKFEPSRDKLLIFSKESKNLIVSATIQNHTIELKTTKNGEKQTTELLFKIPIESGREGKILTLSLKP